MLIINALQKPYYKSRSHSPIQGRNRTGYRRTVIGSNEAVGLLWAALRRLQEPDVSKDEAKKLRLVIQGVKIYIHLEADYLVRMRRIESEALSEWKHLAASWKIQLNRAQTPEDKAKYAKLLGSAQEHIKVFIEAGVKEVKELKEID